jgi:hypothetical protein
MGTMAFIAVVLLIAAYLLMADGIPASELPQGEGATASAFDPIYIRRLRCGGSRASTCLPRKTLASESIQVL